ncbi:hypothetical protein HYPSUDRAFT_183483 [Hypholoma sublateritium FD-334 SS-4]|uniref:F-box domain-containing protein n=1 Tax=Hypholoma sublateritium (strain FD-334 SS-4) TaxID=945553 RepID=A0A0D2P0P1_HYPSF|nr:hypothetical protein HYPSUDRAFT_183483 [Hypholoma sublateritium FD-334 SS-4]
MSLPIELLDHIAAHLHTADLRALAAASARLYHVAQRRLYRHVHLDARALACVFTLAASPRIARHVRSFAIRIGHGAPLLHAFYRVLARALAHMSELTELDISLDQAASWVLRTPAQPAFARLRRFSSSFQLDHNVVHFLGKTPALLQLHIDSLAEPLRLPDTALPRLAQFTGSALAAHALVPGRPVQDIHLTSGDLTEDLAESLAQSTAPVLVLAAATTSHSLSLIATLTRCMAELVHLRIVTTYTFDNLPDSTYFANIKDALTSLPDLQSCEIWGLHWVSSKKSFHDQGRAWESEPFNLPPNNLLANGAFLDDLHSDLSYAY